MADGSLSINPVLNPIPHADYEEIQAGKRTLYLFGYVEYRDKAGRRYRSGYARHYDPTQAKNNLLYVTKRGYNYDREIDEKGNFIEERQKSHKDS